MLLPPYRKKADKKAKAKAKKAAKKDPTARWYT
jgi:hypothetical protein